MDDDSFHRGKFSLEKNGRSAKCRASGTAKKVGPLPLGAPDEMRTSREISAGPAVPPYPSKTF